jgi:hypothetical protein
VDELPLDSPRDPALLRDLLRLARVLPPHAAPATREERLRRDPLRFIPEARLAAAAGPAPVPDSGPFVLEASDPAFCGQGWWQAERTASGALRWSGAAPCATLLLPALGGGDLALTLTVRSPFGIPLDIGGYDVLLDGAPLAFETLADDGVVGTFMARSTLPPMPAGARVALLMHAEWHADPATGPGRDSRRLGLGLMSLRLERA